jgi:predicted esterase
MVDDVPVFVLRGAADRPMVGVFLHGYCTHGMGYLQAFQFAAAEVGPFIALQGDVRCPGPFRAWSGDIRAIDRRIDAALQAYIGRTAPEIVLVGSSQGADRAVGLARAFPGKYRHLILQSGAAPVPPSLVPEVSAAYLLVGQNEGQQAMRTTADLWRRAGRRVALTVVERTGHADFGGRGDPLMREAFQFVGVAP